MTPMEIMARALASMDDTEYSAATLQAISIASALEANGYAIVPVEPTFEMKMAGAASITADMMKANANYDAACDCWPAMIAARPV